MMPPAQPEHEAAFVPLTRAERRHLGSLLKDVSTRSLLHSLIGIERDSEDAQLIIAELLDRLPPGAA